MKTRRRRIDVNLDELDQIIDRSTRAPLSASEGQQLKAALHAMAERLMPKRSTEKTSAVLPCDAAPAGQSENSAPAASGHGRHSAAAFRGANRVAIAHATLHAGDLCLELRRRKKHRQEGRRRWSDLWGTRRWKPLCLRWSGCAAMPVDKCSPPTHRRRRARTSTMQPPWR